MILLFMTSVFGFLIDSIGSKIEEMRQFRFRLIWVFVSFCWNKGIEKLLSKAGPKSWVSMGDTSAELAGLEFSDLISIFRFSSSSLMNLESWKLDEGMKENTNKIVLEKGNVVVRGHPWVIYFVILVHEHKEIKEIPVIQFFDFKESFL